MKITKADLAKLKKKMQKRIAAELDLPVRKTRDISSAIRSEPRKEKDVKDNR